MSSSTSTSSPVTIDPHSEFLFQRKLEFDDYLSKLTPQHEPGFAHKICESDSTWFKHPDTNRSWTNYTTCIDVQDFELRRQINLIYITGYTISLIAILLSISIFCYFR
ncbi:hypothetical protein PVAND_012433 [Polypedilum vanderplanki]|uniref:Uncharacterized protein n=1 Tax=Polypedilum vanderplanki TaxID=319348 RepID=A0A9J6CME4_POLVA|nr:hypothetical protein PVAND_012433 [Polypedilum vanderplanki]